MTVLGISAVVCGVAIVYVNKKRRILTFATALALAGLGPVSYTHLTLPTILLV